MQFYIFMCHLKKMGFWIYKILFAQRRVGILLTDRRFSGHSNTTYTTTTLISYFGMANKAITVIMLNNRFEKQPERNRK